MSRKISFSGIILAGTLLFCTDLSAQRLCRNDSTGFVRWVSGNCPSGFTNINNSVRSEYLRTNSVTTAKIQDGAVTDAKIAGVSAGKVDFTGWTAPNNSVATASIQNGAVTDAKIAGVSAGKIDFTGWTVPAGAVVSSSIATGAVTSAAIADGTITTQDVNQIDASKIVNLPVQGGNIGPHAVTTPKLKNNAVTAAKILDGELKDIHFASNANIAFSKFQVGSGAISASMIANNAVGQSALAGNAVTLTKVADNAVTSEKILDGTIVDADISPGAQIAWSKINKGTGIPGSALASNAVDGSRLADNAVTTDKLTTGAVQVADLADNAVTTPKLATGAVDSTAIANNSITNADIASDAAIGHTKFDFTGFTWPNNSIVSSSISPNSVTGGNLANDSITVDKLADNSITTAKFANNAVTAAKLGTNEVVGTSNIGDNQVDSAALATDAVTTVKIADQAVDTSALASGAGTSAKIIDGAITTQKLADNAVQSANIAPNAVTNSKINLTMEPEEMPYYTFLAVTQDNLTPPASTQYLSIVGTNQALSATHTPVTTQDFANCTQGYLSVRLDAAPGTGNSWTFDLRDEGGAPISGSSVTIAGTNTSNATPSSFTIPAAVTGFSIGVSSGGTPANNKATIYFICRPN
jgi:hypothetical protein